MSQPTTATFFSPAPAISPAPVLRADYLLKAVPLPAGAHRVVLDFEPGVLLPALAVFTGLGLVGLAGAIACGFAGLLRETRGRPDPKLIDSP